MKTAVISKRIGGRILGRLVRHRSHLGTNFAALDGLRGVAVLLVVFSHMSVSGVSIHPALNFSGAGKLGVYLFFVLSAFLLSHQYLAAPPAPGTQIRYWAGYTVRRVLRIYPMFIVALVAGTLNAFLAMAIFGPHEVSIVRHLALLDGVKILWAIPVEMKFYLLLPVILVTYSRILSRRPVVAIGVLFAVIVAKEWLWPVTRFGGLSIALLRYLSAFLYGVMGAIIHMIYRQMRGTVDETSPGTMSTNARRWSPLDAIALVIFGTIIFTTPGIYRSMVGADGPVFHFGLHIAWYGFAWMLCVLVALNPGTATRRLLETPLLRWWGIVSFSVYLCHLPVVEWIRRALWGYPKPAQACVILVLTLVISTCTYLVVERPFILLGSWLSRRIYAGTRRSASES